LRPRVRPADPPLAIAPPAAASRHATRWLSLLALCGLLGGIVYVAAGLYAAYRDSFVTPIVLSPDSDLVIPSKLSLSRLIADKTALEIRIREAEAVLAADERAGSKLQGLQQLVGQSLAWSDWVVDQTHNTSASDLAALSEQQQLLAQHISLQTAYVAEMERNLAAGLVHKSDVLREQNQLSQLRIAALENQRERGASQAQLRQSAAAKRALSGARGSRVLTPEMIQQRDQLVRIELELLRLEADKRARTDELRGAREDLARTDQLISQMKQRPVFRAIEAEQNVAFVPYSQLEGVRAGSEIHACALWGLFGCRDVGRVLTLLPGEVSLTDAWGSPARGQYALMKLTDAQAARAKLLRVRPSGSQPAATLAGQP
jgi:hypothetical protein